MLIFFSYLCLHVCRFSFSCCPLPFHYGASFERMLTSRCLCAILRQCTITLSLNRCPLLFFCLFCLIVIAVSVRAGHVPTFFKLFRSVLKRGPSARLFRSRSFFSIVPFLFQSVPFHFFMSRRMVILFCFILGILSGRTVPSLLFHS